MNSVLENTSLIYSNNNTFVVNSLFLDPFDSLFYSFNIILFVLIYIYFLILSIFLETRTI